MGSNWDLNTNFARRTFSVTKASSVITETAPKALAGRQWHTASHVVAYLGCKLMVHVHSLLLA